MVPIHDHPPPNQHPPAAATTTTTQPPPTRYMVCGTHEGGHATGFVTVADAGASSGQSSDLPLTGGSRMQENMKVSLAKLVRTEWAPCSPLPLSPLSPLPRSAKPLPTSHVLPEKQQSRMLPTKLQIEKGMLRHDLTESPRPLESPPP